MTSLRLKRGTTTQNNNYTGPPGELTVDTTSNQLRLHNGTTVGGVVIGDLTVTSVKTSAYNANVNELVRIDSTTGSFTITLPATPIDGARISFLDIANQCGTNPVLVAANGKTILGDSTGISLDANGAGLSLVFNNLTNNWSNIDMFSSSMSVVIDLTPDAFNFTDQTGIALNSTITSNTVTITGLSPNVSITVSGSGGTIDAGTSSLSGTFAANKTVTTSGTGTIVVAGRMTSSGSYNQQTSMTITAGTVSDTWYSTTMSTPVGEQVYTTPGTYNWTAPAGVTSVCVVCVGGGGTYVAFSGTNGYGGGGGGALSYANNISVTPGNNYNVIVGIGANSYTINNQASGNGGDSSFNATSCKAGGGKGSNFSSPTLIGGAGGTVLYGTGGAGGAGGGVMNNDYTQGAGGGGGAGGYSGAGGAGAQAAYYIGQSSYPGGGGAGGGAGGGCLGCGGGVGLYGQGSSGAGGTNELDRAGKGGSGGGNGGGAGGLYGGGAGASSGNVAGSGAVRIIWGPGRSFPSNAA